MGVLLAMTFYNAILFVFTKDLAYFIYTACIAFIILYQLGVSGYGRLYIWGDSPWFRDYAYSAFAALCFLSATYFFRHFLKLKQYGGWILRTNTLLLSIWCAIFIGIFTPLHPLALALSAPMGLIVTFIGIVTATYLWSKGNRQAKYFLIAWIGISLSTTLILCVLLGAISYFSGVNYLQTLAFVLEAVLLSIALADRINSEKESREQAQALAIERQTELLRVQKKANEELEENVRKRTLELAAVAVDLERANEELAHKNQIDGLTSLYNRGHFNEAIEKEVKRACRNRLPLSIILTDIDHFKSINDNYGHQVGDKCLQMVARTMTQTISRVTDIVARYGGEEFVAILPDTSESNAIIVGEKLRKAIENLAFISDGKKIPLSISLGVAGRSLIQGDTSDRLIRAADEAMYQAKRSGRNRVELGVITYRYSDDLQLVAKLKS